MENYSTMGRRSCKYFIIDFYRCLAKMHTMHWERLLRLRADELKKSGREEGEKGMENRIQTFMALSTSWKFQPFGREKSLTASFDVLPVWGALLHIALIQVPLILTTFWIHLLYSIESPSSDRNDRWTNLTCSFKWKNWCRRTTSSSQFFASESFWCHMAPNDANSTETLERTEPPYGSWVAWPSSWIRDGAGA